MNYRVCDTCIRKKAKCNQARPACSRCLERGEVCSYSSKRRKPGPQPGLTRPSLSSGSQVNPGQRGSHDQSDITTGTSTPTLSISPERYPGPNELPNPGHLEATQGAIGNIDPIGANQEEHLLQRYFDIIQDANPIFSKARFLHLYRNAQCDRDLISTMVTITAKLTAPMPLTDSAVLDARIDSLLSSTTIHDDLFTSFPSLDQFRKSCVLSFYEFHQFPGHQSWTKIGNLTRVAYRLGLDRLENLRKLQPEWRLLGEEDMDEWRAVWWCIYRLDSYSNLASGTPYLIDPNMITTALILRSPNQPLGIDNTSPEVLLSADPDNLWRLLPAVISCPDMVASNMHNITITIMRYSGQLMRVRLLRPQEEAIGRIANVERKLSAFRLALPPGWLSPKRNAFSYESPAEHHASWRQDEWPTCWQEVIEACQNIASVAEQWDTFFCIRVDPAISFIIFTALIFLDLHKKSTAISDFAVHSQIDHDKTVLQLQLEQFAKLWTLPRLLNLSFATFHEEVPGPVTYDHIKRILSRFEAPLHPRWLQFLSNPQTHLENC